MNAFQNRERGESQCWRWGTEEASRVRPQGEGQASFWSFQLPSSLHLPSDAQAIGDGPRLVSSPISCERHLAHCLFFLVCICALSTLDSSTTRVVVCRLLSDSPCALFLFYTDTYIKYISATCTRATMRHPHRAAPCGVPVKCRPLTKENTR